MPSNESIAPYTIRRLLPEDAPGVTGCIRQIYGDSYIHDEVYHPEQLIRLNRTGELVSVVAVHTTGVVGHYALERPGLGLIAEEGEALVLPAHRHQHLMESMRGLLEDEAHRLDLVGLVSQAVTNHVFTQRAIERFGVKPCALSLGGCPRTFHNMPELLPQRMSLLLAFKYLHPPSRVMVHVPAEHQPICAEIYQQLGVAVEFLQGEAAEQPGRVEADFLPRQQEAIIRVRRVGADSASEVSGLKRDFCDRSGAEAVFLELPLSDPGTPALCRSVQREGFFFSGIGPGFAVDGDALRLQFLNVSLDAGLLQLENPFARKLLDYVSGERERVAACLLV